MTNAINKGHGNPKLDANQPCLISIIVPAFNTGAHIRRCVNSILGQIHKEIELIVVNDCSSDDTANILDEMAATDSRIKAIHLTENVGVHAARSRGVSVASGQYIGFVDADDWIAPEMFASLIKEATTGEGADIVICGAVLATAVGKTGRHKVRFRRRKKLENHLLERFCRLEFGSGVLWNKLYRTDLIRPYALLGLERKVDAAEDYIVNIGCFANAGRVVVLPETHYFYFVHPGSASRSTSNAKSFSRTLRAYVVCLEAYAGVLRAEFIHISNLYRLQLKLSCYQVQSFSDLTSYCEEIRESLVRLARVYPEGVYALIHTFNAVFDENSIHWRTALKQLLAAARNVGRAVMNQLNAVKYN